MDLFKSNVFPIIIYCPKNICTNVKFKCPRNLRDEIKVAFNEGSLWIITIQNLHKHTFTSMIEKGKHLINHPIHSKRHCKCQLNHFGNLSCTRKRILTNIIMFPSYSLENNKNLYVDYTTYGISEVTTSICVGLFL